MTNARPVRLFLRFALSVAVALAAMLILGRGIQMVYRSRYPSTLDLAVARLENTLQPNADRLVLADGPGFRSRGAALSFAHNSSSVELVGRLNQLAPQRLQLADALVFPRPGWIRTSPFYHDLVNRTPGQQLSYVEPRWFAVAGPALVVIDRGWRPVLPSVMLAAEPCPDASCYVAALPSWVRPGEYVSLRVRLPRFLAKRFRAPPVVIIGEETSDLVWTARERWSSLYLSQRFVIARPNETIRVPATVTRSGALQVTVLRWRDGSGAATVTPTEVRPRLFWQQEGSDDLVVWRLDRTEPPDILTLPIIDPGFEAVGCGEVDVDGRVDLVLRNRATGGVEAWRLDGITSPIGKETLTGDLHGESPLAVGDLNGDGHTDVVTGATPRSLHVWLGGIGGLLQPVLLDRETPPDSVLGAVADLDRNGAGELIWQSKATGALRSWSVAGTAVARETRLEAALPPGWQLKASIGVDGLAALLFVHPSESRPAVWVFRGDRFDRSFYLPPVGQGWRLVAAR